MMNLMGQNETLFLGAGGVYPGVDRFVIDTGKIERLVSFGPGESVYAIAVGPDNDQLAVGTKAGTLYVSEGPTAREDQSCCFKKLIQGAAVLSVLFLDGQRFAVSDAAGRCLIWAMADNEPCGRFKVPHGPVCAVFRINSDQLAGLSVTGELIFWELGAHQIVDILEIPTPPVLGALVNPLYWKAAGCWVWSAEGGAVVLYHVDQNKITTLYAHSGQIYAIAVCNDELMTLGKNDRRVKCWPIDSHQPSKSFTLHTGVISTAVWGASEKKILLINETGLAEMGLWCHDHLEQIQRLNGRDYRIVVEPDRERFASRLRQMKIQKAENLARQIKTCIENHQIEGIDSLHGQLVDLGFKHLSLLLHAWQAQCCDDRTGEIQAYKELRTLLEQKQLSLPDSFMRYGQLLEQLWLIESAANMYRQLLALKPDNPLCRRALERVNGYITAIRDGDYVIESEMAIPTLAEQVASLNEPFVGRFVINKMDAPILCDGTLSADDFIDLYEKLRWEKTQISLPPARKKNLHWFSRDGIDQKEAILFSDSRPDFGNCLQLALKLIHSEYQTIFVPVILFESPVKKAHGSIQSHNQQMLEQLQRTENKIMAGARLKKVYSNVNHVIRQLLTRQLAKREK